MCGTGHIGTFITSRSGHQTKFNMSTLNNTTSSTRPTLGGGDIGKSYFETDTNNILVWDGSSWQIYQSDGVAYPWTANAYSVSYDGTDDFHTIVLDGRSTGGVLASNDTDIEMTFSFWFKPTDGVIFTWTHLPGTATATPTIQLTPTSSGGTTYKLYLDLNYRHTFSNSEIVPSAWNHFMLTRSKGTNVWQVFCNGNSTPVVSYNDGGSLGDRSSMQNLYISRGYWGYGQHIFDHVAFWNTDKSSNLAAIYGSSTPGSGSPSDISSLLPYGWWRMGDNNGASNGGAAGTITNIGSTAPDMGVGGGSPTYSTDIK